MFWFLVAAAAKPVLTPESPDATIPILPTEEVEQDGVEGSGVGSGCFMNGNGLHSALISFIL